MYGGARAGTQLGSWGFIGLHRLSLSDPLLHRNVPPTPRQSLGLDSQLGGGSARPYSRTRVDEPGWEGRERMGHEWSGSDLDVAGSLTTAVSTEDTAVGLDAAVGMQQLLLRVEQLEREQRQGKLQRQKLNQLERKCSNTQKELRREEHKRESLGVLVYKEVASQQKAAQEAQQERNQLQAGLEDIREQLDYARKV